MYTWYVLPAELQNWTKQVFVAILTWVVQARWCGSCSAAAADWGSGAEGRAAAAGGLWRKMSPDGEEGLCLPSGQEGYTDGTLTS